MKNKVMQTLITTGAAVLGLICGIGIGGYSLKANHDAYHYPYAAMVTEIDSEENIVTVTGANGNQFQFYGTEDWYLGDLCSMIMHNRGTIEVYDDVIVDAEYVGYTQLFLDIEETI